MRILVTILARANSKGFPGKNLKMFFGKPLYMHTVDQALAWGKGDIACSTDSEEIIQGLPMGVEPIRRPYSLCEDDTPKIPAIRHALKVMEANKSITYDAVIDLDVTNPLRKPTDIEDAFQLFLEKKPPVLFSVTEARRSPYFNQIEFDKDGFIRTPKSKNNQIYRRQDAPEVFDLNCSIYIYDRTWLLRGNNSPIVGDACIYKMQKNQFCDVDNEVDWTVLKALFWEYFYKKKVPGEIYGD